MEIKTFACFCSFRISHFQIELNVPRTEFGLCISRRGGDGNSSTNNIHKFRVIHLKNGTDQHVGLLVACFGLCAKQIRLNMRLGECSCTRA